MILSVPHQENIKVRSLEERPEFVLLLDKRINEVEEPIDFSFKILFKHYMFVLKINSNCFSVSTNEEGVYEYQIILSEIDSSTSQNLHTIYDLIDSGRLTYENLHENSEKTDLCLIIVPPNQSNRVCHSQIIIFISHSHPKLLRPSPNQPASIIPPIP